MACEPSRPPSSAEYQWNSMVFGAEPFAISGREMRTRRASRMVILPLPSSSAPGAGRTEGRKRLMLSWCAPTTTVLLLRPGMVAITEAWPQLCTKGLTLATLELAMVALTWLRSQAEDSAP